MKIIIMLSVLMALSAFAQTNIVTSMQPNQFQGGHVTNQCSGQEYFSSGTFTNASGSVIFSVAATNTPLSLICTFTNNVTCTAFCYERPDLGIRCGIGRLDFTNGPGQLHFALGYTSPSHVRNYPLPTGTTIGFQ